MLGSDYRLLCWFRQFLQSALCGQLYLHSCDLGFLCLSAVFSRFIFWLSVSVSRFANLGCDAVYESQRTSPILRTHNLNTEVTVSETSKLLFYFSPTPSIPRDVNENKPDSRILDTIAAALTTGDVYEVLAKTFHTTTVCVTDCDKRMPTQMSVSFAQRQCSNSTFELLIHSASSCRCTTIPLQDQTPHPTFPHLSTTIANKPPLTSAKSTLSILASSCPVLNNRASPSCTCV